MEVNSNSVLVGLSTLIQRLIIAGLSYFGITGYFSNDDVAKITAAIVVILVAVWGAIRSYISNEQKKTLANFVPDSIAKVK